MAKKLYDMVVKNGTYKNRDGEDQARWLTIGSIIQTEKGQIALINRTFNPAGVIGEDNSESVLASLMPADRDNRDSRGVGINDAPF